MTHQQATQYALNELIETLLAHVEELRTLSAQVDKLCIKSEKTKRNLIKANAELSEITDEMLRRTRVCPHCGNGIGDPSLTYCNNCN